MILNTFFIYLISLSLTYNLYYHDCTELLLIWHIGLKFIFLFILDQAVAAPEAVLANLAAELVVAVRNVGVAEGVEPVEVGVAAKKNRQAHPQHKR